MNFIQNSSIKVFELLKLTQLFGKFVSILIIEVYFAGWSELLAINGGGHNYIWILEYPFSTKLATTSFTKSRQ